jgi:hypothetical protein
MVALRFTPEVVGMQLTAEWFQAVVKGLRSDEKASRHHDKRKEGRVGVPCFVDLVPVVFHDRGLKVLRVKVRDISPSGMGFISHTKLEVGNELVCKLPCENRPLIQVVMTVRHCLKISEEL